MAEFIQAPLRDQMEIKIFILYLMEHIARPLTFIEVNDIVVQNGVVKPFDFCLSFPDLIEKGHILRTEENGTELFSVTDFGRSVLENLENRLLTTTKERALRNAFELLNMQKTDTGYRYQIEAHPDGTFWFHIAMTEHKTDVLSVIVRADTEQDAKNMEVEFEHHPELFRRALLSLLRNNAPELISYEPFALR